MKTFILLFSFAFLSTAQAADKSPCGEQNLSQKEFDDCSRAAENYLIGSMVTGTTGIEVATPFVVKSIIDKRNANERVLSKLNTLETRKRALAAGPTSTHPKIRASEAARLNAGVQIAEQDLALTQSSVEVKTFLIKSRINKGIAATALIGGGVAAWHLYQESLGALPGSVVDSHHFTVKQASSVVTAEGGSTAAPDNTDVR